VVNVEETYILQTFEPQVLKPIDRNVSARFKFRAQPSIGRLSRKSEVALACTSVVTSIQFRSGNFD
jgi:hypothetical protein